MACFFMFVSTLCTEPFLDPLVVSSGLGSFSSCPQHISWCYSHLTVQVGWDVSPCRLLPQSHLQLLDGWPSAWATKRRRAVWKSPHNLASGGTSHLFRSLKVHYMCAWCPQEWEEHTTGVKNSFTLIYGCWQPSPCPLQEQEVLLTMGLSFHTKRIVFLLSTSGDVTANS